MSEHHEPVRKTASVVLEKFTFGERTLLPGDILEVVDHGWIIPPEGKPYYVHELDVKRGGFSVFSLEIDIEKKARLINDRMITKD